MLLSMLSCSSDDVNKGIKEEIKDETEKSIKNYFKERISNSNHESVMISFEGLHRT